MSNISVARVRAQQSDVVGTLVYRLLSELNPEKYANRSTDEFAATARRLLEDDSIWAFVADADNGSAVGVLTLNECSAVYAGGHFGEICELYVDPEYRSYRVGAKLIDAASVFGLERGWGHLEVGAPDLPRWQRTVDFYTSYGFSVVGPRLNLKL